MIRLTIVLLLTIIIYATETLAYAARLAGIRTKRVAVARSLYNLVALGARMAATFQAPLFASLVDVAVIRGALGDLEIYSRAVVGAMTVGYIGGAVLVPWASRVIETGIHSFERRGSLPRVVIRGVSVRGLYTAWGRRKRPHSTSVVEAGRQPFPKRVFFITAAITSLYCVGGMAALYASALVPQWARTATTLPALISGFGTILLVFLVDPIFAILMDQALRGEKPVSAATYIIIWQLSARVIGSIFAQVLFMPIASLIVWLTTKIMGG